MHLVNINKIRIQCYKNKGWAVEIQKKTWYGRTYWVHLISVSGIESKAWYYPCYMIALNEACKYFKWDLINGTDTLSNG